MGTHQLGRIYEASEKFYVQYRVAVNGKRVQRSHFLCAKGTIGTVRSPTGR